MPETDETAKSVESDFAEDEENHTPTDMKDNNNSPPPHVVEPEMFNEGWGKGESAIGKRIAYSQRILLASSAALCAIIGLLVIGVFYGVSINAQIRSFFGIEDRAEQASSFVEEQVDLLTRKKAFVRNIQVVTEYPSVADRLIRDIKSLSINIEKGHKLTYDDFNQIVNRSTIRSENNNIEYRLIGFGFDTSGISKKLLININTVVYAGEQTRLQSSPVFASDNVMSLFGDPSAVLAALPQEEQSNLLVRISARLEAGRQDAAEAMSKVVADEKRASEEIDKRSKRFASEIAPDIMEPASKIVFMLTLYTIAGMLVRLILTEMKFRNRLIEMQVSYAFSIGVTPDAKAFGEIMKRFDNKDEAPPPVVGEKYLDKILDLVKSAIKR